jgi:iron uptake system component EfeO
VQGAGVAFGAVRALAESKGAEGEELAAEIDAQFTALEEALAAYGSLDAGFTDYAELTAADKKALSDQVNALAEPLSQLTHTVLGVAEPES